MACIRITAEALTNLRLHAKQGYESCYKKEVGGLWIGTYHSHPETAG